MRHKLLLILLVAFTPAGNSQSFWKSHIDPLFNQHCYRCHGETRQKGGLDLRAPDLILKGGLSGAAIVPGHPEKSLLFKVLQPDADPHMPPESEKRQLSTEQKELVKTWIEKFTSDVLGTNSSVKIPEWENSPSGAGVSAYELKWQPPPGLSVSESIDAFVAREWKLKKVRPARLTTDNAFVRRVYLDLAGRIPTEAEARNFTSNKQASKRRDLVNSLMESPEFARHMAEVFDTVLMGRATENAAVERRKHGWMEFLERSFAQNKPWNQLVREMILARPSGEHDRGAFWFLYERRNNYQQMAEAIAPVVFGMKVNCAQCHNHPLVREIEQKHYWALVAAFNRGKNVETEKGPAVAETATGGFVYFTNLKKETQAALLTFLNGKNVVEPHGEDAKDMPAFYRIPPPAEKQRAKEAAVPVFSRRAELAALSTEENKLLARAFVNRMWALFMGRGLVHPVDEIDSAHPPSHPDLLEWLSQKFHTSGYNVKELVSALVLTTTYQLDSKPAGKETPADSLFARGLEKPLSGETLYRSMLVATDQWAGHNAAANSATTNRLAKLFIEKFPELFPMEYNASLAQAMFLQNNSTLSGFVDASEREKSEKTSAQSENPASQIRLVFNRVYGREPDRDELAACQKLLKSHDREKAVRELFLALFSTPEFLLNH